MEDHFSFFFVSSFIFLHVPSKLHTRNILLPTALRSTTLLIMTSTGSTSVSPVCQTSVSASHLCLWKFTSLRSVNDLPTKIQPSTSSRLHQVYRSNPRPISNSQLHTLLHFHLCPIYLVVFKGSYFFRMGYLILRGGSRLDAFSVYPFRTWLPCHAAGNATGTPAVRPSRSSRTKDSSSQISYAHAG